MDSPSDCEDVISDIEDTLEEGDTADIDFNIDDLDISPLIIDDPSILEVVGNVELNELPEIKSGNDIIVSR